MPTMNDGAEWVYQDDETGQRSRKAPFPGPQRGPSPLCRLYFMRLLSAGYIDMPRGSEGGVDFATVPLLPDE